MEQNKHGFKVEVFETSGLPAGTYVLKEANHQRLEFAKEIKLSIKKIGSKVKLKAQSCSDAYSLPAKEMDAVNIAMGVFTGTIVLALKDRLITVEFENGEMMSFG